MLWGRPVTGWVLDGDVLIVERPPTATLVGLLLTHPVWLVLTTIVDEEPRNRFYQELVRFDSRITDELVHDVADRLIESWFGMPRYRARLLWQEAASMWPQLDGELLGRNCDVAQLPAERATAVIYHRLSAMHANDKDKGERWRKALNETPLAAVRKQAAEPVSKDGEGFMAMLAMSGGRGR